MAPYEQEMQDLASKSPEELQALETQIMAAFQEADDNDDLDSMSAAADALDQVRAARGSSAPDEAPTDAPAEASPPMPLAADGGPVAVAPAATIPTQPKAPEATETAPEAPATPEAPAEAAPDEAPVEGAPEGSVAAPVASETPAEAPADAEPEAAPAEGDETTPETVESAQDTDTKQEDPPMEIPEARAPLAAAANPVTITAGADIPGVSAGTEYKSITELTKAFTSRLGAISRAQGSGEQYIVATVASAAPADRIFTGTDDAEANLRKAMEVVGPQAIVAAGGWCAPLTTMYDIFGLGVADRPVRDSLAGFQAERGGVRFPTPPKLSDLTGATGLWTAANDVNPTAPTTKPRLTIACAAEQTATLDAITLQLKFGNLMTRAFPELVARNIELGLIAHARLAESTLLAKLTANSTALTSGFALGTARDFILAVTRAAVAYRSRNRMVRTAPLRLLAPNWVYDACIADLMIGLDGGEQFLEAQNQFDAAIRSLNVNVGWHMENGFGAEVAATAVDDFPATFTWHLFAEGTFLFLDGGTLDLGVVRDGTLVGTNDYIQFSETFEGLAKVGLESMAITSTTHLAGATAGTINSAQTGAGPVAV